MNESLQNALANLSATLNAKLSEKPAREKADSWEKAKTIANWVAAIAVPVVLGISGYYVNLSLKGKEVQSTMVALAIEILKEPPQDFEESKSIRSWAIEVINHYSDVQIPKATQRVIIQDQPLVPRTSSRSPLLEEYRQLFDTMVLMDDHRDIVKGVAKRIEAGRERYKKVSSKTGVPWFIVGILHQIESGGSFDVHIHNGDPLTNRTVNMPAGHPATGNPPFLWEDSAADALRMHKLNKVTTWTIEEALLQLEGYNGFGYYLNHPSVKSPYLWGGSNHYTKGKYTADGTWSDSAVSKQIGGAVLLKFAVSAKDLESLISREPKVTHKK